VGGRYGAAVGTILELPGKDVPGHQPSGLGGDDHPMRIMTRRAAGLVQPPWDEGARREVAAYFDGLAPEWHTRTSPERDAVVADALERGDVAGGGLALEVGSGIGAYSGLLASRYRDVLALEIAAEMLARAPARPAHRVLADAAQLPVGDRRADAVVLVNAFLFPAEVDRVLAADGLVVWVNSSGATTPIHLRPDQVAAALPGAWSGTSSTAGAGVWCVLRRAAPGSG
jgi:SAM-dependent methyltransferase